MRTKKHYEDMLSKNPNASIGLTLAAQAVYAARHGNYPGPNEDDGTDVDEWRTIAMNLKSKYGENLTAGQVRAEMGIRSKYSTGTQNISLAIRRDLLDRLNELAEKSGQSRNGLIITSIEVFLASRAARLLVQEKQEN